MPPSFRGSQAHEDCSSPLVSSPAPQRCSHQHSSVCNCPLHVYTHRPVPCSPQVSPLAPQSLEAAGPSCCTTAHIWEALLCFLALHPVLKLPQSPSPCPALLMSWSGRAASLVCGPVHDLCNGPWPSCLCRVPSSSTCRTASPPQLPPASSGVRSILDNP